MKGRTSVLLWHEIRHRLSLYGSMSNHQFATMLDIIADKIETRATCGADLDQAETVEWLRMEAQRTSEEG